MREPIDLGPDGPVEAARSWAKALDEQGMVTGHRFWEWSVLEDRRELPNGDEIVVFVKPDGRRTAVAQLGWQEVVDAIGLRMKRTADGWQAVAFVPTVLDADEPPG